VLALGLEDDYMNAVDETDRGRPGAERLRTCIATREAKPVDELLRFVVSPQGEVVPDLKAVLPGRGVWVTATAEAVKLALQRRAFTRGFKRDVEVPPDLAAKVENLLLDRAREALALANKAGAVVTGFGKVESAIAGRPLALLHAVVAGEDGVEKLDRRYRAVAGDDALILRVFTGVEMDLALGRSNVVHAALDRGPAARACLNRIRSLLRYRSGELSIFGNDRRDGEGGRPSSRTDRE
jgi:uncharacterized protein